MLADDDEDEDVDEDEDEDEDEDDGGGYGGGGGGCGSFPPTGAGIPLGPAEQSSMRFMLHIIQLTNLRNRL